MTGIPLLVAERLPALLTPAEVARLFRVSTKTVTRWAAAGHVTAIRTPGGKYRYPRDEVLALLDTDPTPGAAAAVAGLEPGSP